MSRATRDWVMLAVHKDFIEGFFAEGGGYTSDLKRALRLTRRGARVCEQQHPGWKAVRYKDVFRIACVRAPLADCAGLPGLDAADPTQASRSPRARADADTLKHELVECVRAYESSHRSRHAGACLCAMCRRARAAIKRGLS